MKRTAAVVAGLFIFMAPAAHGRNYVRSLVGNLLEIGYPISNADVIALDKIAMRFDSRNRLDVLKQILLDRGKIHGIQGAGYFAKTEAICNALRLLDEHNLPETDALIAALSRQGGWEKREKELLSYMAAKRDMDYESNVAYLLSALRQYRGNAAADLKVEISVEILDLCNLLSYLADIFNHTGDVQILTTLIHYAVNAYGYPAEYSSRLLVDMFLQQPKVFIPVLAATDQNTRKTIIDSMVFGIWNNQQKGNVLEVIHKGLTLKDDRERKTVSLLTEKINRKFAPGPTNNKDLHIDPNSKK